MNLRQFIYEQFGASQFSRIELETAIRVCDKYPISAIDRIMFEFDELARNEAIKTELATGFHQL